MQSYQIICKIPKPPMSANTYPQQRRRTGLMPVPLKVVLFDNRVKDSQKSTIPAF